MFLPVLRYSVFRIIQALMAHISAWNTVVWSPWLKLCPLLEPHLYLWAAVPLLVLDPSAYQTRPCLLSRFNPFCHLRFSGNLTVNGLWYAYLRSILSDHLCRMDFFGVTKVSRFRSPLLGTHQSVDSHLGLCLSHHMKRKKSQSDLHCSFCGHLYHSCFNQTNLCNLLNSVLPTLCLILDHQTVKL